MEWLAIFNPYLKELREKLVLILYSKLFHKEMEDGMLENRAS